MTLTRRTLLGTGAAFALRAVGGGGLTRYVAEFVVRTKLSDFPPDVIELGKKSMLDGLGLALAGSVSQLGKITSGYVQSLGESRNDATIIGLSRKSPARFAAFAISYIYD